MSKRRKKPSGQNNKQRPRKPRTLRQRLRRYRGVGILFAVLAAVLVIGRVYVAYNDPNDDVSVIGNGTPTIVQLYDQGCIDCRELDDNMTTARENFTEQEVQFRVLNVNTREGQDFAARYNAGRTTLLYFDGGGWLVNSRTGVQSAEAITDSARRLIEG